MSNTSGMSITQPTLARTVLPDKDADARCNYDVCACHGYMARLHLSAAGLNRCANCIAHS